MSVRFELERLFWWNTNWTPRLQIWNPHSYGIHQRKLPWNTYWSIFRCEADLNDTTHIEEYTAGFFTVVFTPEPLGSHLSGLNSSASSPKILDRRFERWLWMVRENGYQFAAIHSVNCNEYEGVLGKESLFDIFAGGGFDWCSHWNDCIFTVLANHNGQRRTSGSSPWIRKDVNVAAVRTAVSFLLQLHQEAATIEECHSRGRPRRALVLLVQPLISVCLAIPDSGTTPEGTLSSLSL